MVSAAVWGQTTASGSNATMKHKYLLVLSIPKYPRLPCPRNLEMLVHPFVAAIENHRSDPVVFLPHRTWTERAIPPEKSTSNT